MTFEMWSPLHYVFMASPFIFLFILLVVSRKLNNQQKRILGIVLSLIAVILLVLRNIEIYLDRGFDAEIIPLQICHFANFVMLFAFIFKNNTLFSLSFLLNLPAAYTSIIFANSLSNYQTILTFRGMAYLFGHMMIVSIVLWAFFIGFIKIDKKIFVKTLITMFALYLIAHIVNNGLMYLNLTPNYFYTIIPEGGTPLELFYNWGTNYNFGKFVINPVYLGLTALLGLSIVLIFWGIYKLLLPLTIKDKQLKVVYFHR